MFRIEDEAHAETVGEYPERDSAMAELRRLAGLPWDREPNQAPCSNWQGCGRRYELIEYDPAAEYLRELRRSLVLTISAGGAIWHSER